MNKPKIIKMDEIEKEKPVAVPESLDDAAIVDAPGVAASDDDEAAYTSNPPSGYSASDVARDINRLSTELVGLYNRYSQLHLLAKEMNGLSDAEPIPEHVQIQKISFTYKLPNLNAVTADVLHPHRVGEVAPILMAEIERIVDDITNHLTKIRELSTASEQACTQAKFYNRMAQSKNVPV
jgi:hypothetical protein